MRSRSTKKYLLINAHKIGFIELSFQGFYDKPLINLDTITIFLLEA